MPDTPLATPLQDAIDKVGRLPDNEVNIVVVHEEHGDTGAGIEGSDDFGKPGGWSAAGAAQWMKKAGWSVVGALRWKGKQ